MNQPMPPIIHHNTQGDISEHYERSVQTWLQETDPSKASLHYHTHTFPLTCARISSLRSALPELDLLFVPVGTQVYAPTLAIIGNPSKCIALLETEQSQVYAEAVEAAFASDQSPIVFLHILVSDTNTADIAAKMKAVFDSRGLPSGALVGADITGGRKPMSAAIAGIGSLYGWRLFYVEGQFTRAHQGFSHHEKIIEIINVLDVFGDRERDIALALLSAGACEAAAIKLHLLAHSSAASQRDRAYLALAKALSALRAGETNNLKRLYSKASKALARPLPQSALALLHAVTAGERFALVAILLTAAHYCIKNHDSFAAQTLLQRACDALGEAWSPRVSAMRWLRSTSARHELLCWKPATKHLLQWSQDALDLQRRHPQ